MGYSQTQKQQEMETARPQYSQSQKIHYFRILICFFLFLLNWFSTFKIVLLSWCSLTSKYFIMYFLQIISFPTKPPYNNQYEELSINLLVAFNPCASFTNWPRICVLAKGCAPALCTHWNFNSPAHTQSLSNLTDRLSPPPPGGRLHPSLGHRHLCLRVRRHSAPSPP